MRRIVPLVLVLLGACQSATNVRLATESPDAASSASTEPSYWLVKVLSYWEGATETPREPGSIANWRPHAGSGTCFPLDYGDFTLAKIGEHGPNDESVTLVSELRATTVSLFVYPGTDELTAHFESVRGHMNQNCGAGIAASLSVADERFPGGGKVGLCTRVVEDDLELIEQIVLFSRDGWYYKVRATWPAFLSSTAFKATREITAAAFNPCQAAG